ncbi:unnamed protein product [Schistosoma margrebowiei]|uniref:Uncharacterized protein n=1 Tax=Schistosoma margrebowiei TaxID=48269 RepID=A0A3P8H219_9TREM|nr:unnamed protein product [Schistosoma margrebowiei]
MSKVLNLISRSQISKVGSVYRIGRSVGDGINLVFEIPQPELRPFRSLSYSADSLSAASNKMR